MVKLKSTCLEDTVKATGSVISFELEFTSDLDCHAQSQEFIGSILTDDSKLSGVSISNASLCLEPHVSSSVLVESGFRRPPEDPGIETYFLTEDQPSPLETYYEECDKYLLAPLEAIRNFLQEENLSYEEKHLNLQNYGINSLGIYLIAQAMIGPPVATVTHLNLSNCSFDDIGCIVLSDFLQQSSVLTHLNLSGCPLGVKGAKILYEGVELSQSLVDLNLSKCQLTDPGGAMIIKALLFNENCKRIDLSYDHLMEQSSAEILNLLKQNRILESINLKWNDFFAEIIGPIPIFKGLRQNENLKELNLAWNGMSGKNFSIFMFRALKDHKFLEVLNLENNRISEIELPYILKAIKNSTSLEELYLGGNILSGPNTFDLIKTVGGDVRLKLLHLGEHIWIPENAFLLANQIMNQKPDVKIIFKGKILPNPPDPVDFKALIIDRAKYLAMAPKKKKLKRNLGHFMINAMDSERPHYRRESFEDLLKKFKAKLDTNLIGHLGTEFTEKVGVGKKMAKRVLLKDMAKFYLERHPTERPPPPPPKKKRGKKGKKGKKDDGQADSKKETGQKTANDKTAKGDKPKEKLEGGNEAKKKDKKGGEKNKKQKK